MGDGHWELFAVNDNVNVKHGIKLQDTPGMSKVIKKYKAIRKFRHQSTGAAQMMKKEAIMENLIFRKVVNPC